MLQVTKVTGFTVTQTRASGPLAARALAARQLKPPQGVQVSQVGWGVPRGTLVPSRMQNLPKQRAGGMQVLRDQDAGEWVANHPSLPRDQLQELSAREHQWKQR